MSRFGISILVSVVLLIAVSGCEEQPQIVVHDTAELCAFTNFSPNTVDIVPLTEFAPGQNNQQLNVYVSLLDKFGSKLKAPGVFRFEIYEHVIRSAEPKGKRLMLFPDIDLNDADENNKHWLDFIRAYMFELDFPASPDQTYVLQITFQGPNNKRLIGDLILKP